MAICSGERVEETLCVPPMKRTRDSTAPALVKSSESTHARPKLAAIHAAEEGDQLLGWADQRITAMHVGSQSWRVELVRITFAAANWLV